MKKAAALLIALALMSCGALAEERSFTLNRDQGSDVYSWDGTQLTQSGTLLSIYSITRDETDPGDELFAAQSANQSLPENGDYVAPRYALIDARGAQLTDFLYDSLDYDASGDAILYSIDGLFGAMSRDLKELVPCAYDAVVSDGKGGFLMTEHSDAEAPPVWHMNAGGKPRKTGAKARFYWGSMAEGLCAAYGGNGLYGFLSDKGEWAIKPRFDWAQDFTFGYAIARENGKTGIINKAGKWTVKPTYDDDRGMLPDGSAALLMRGTRVYAVRPSDGKQIFSVRLTQNGYASTGSVNSVISITDKGKTTLYDAGGKKLLSLDDSYSIDLWSEQPLDRLVVTAVNLAKLLDLNGNVLYESQSLYYLDTVDGRALYVASRYKTRTVQYDGYDQPSEEPIYATFRYGIVDSDGREVLPMIYRQLYELVPGRYYAQDAKRWGVIDQDGNWIVSGSLYDQLMD